MQTGRTKYNVCYTVWFPPARAINAFYQAPLLD